MKTISNDIFFAHVESEIREGRSVRFKVKGNSMYPLLRNNRDEVTVSPYNCKPEKMDLVLFRYKGMHVLHRIIAFEGNKYIIQGDGIYSSKEQCAADDIVGFVSIIHKNGECCIDTTSPFYKLSSMVWHCSSFCRRYLIYALRFVYPY